MSQAAIQSNEQGISEQIHSLLASFDLSKYADDSRALKVYSPVNGALIGSLDEHSVEDANDTVDAASAAFRKWRVIPAPIRGQLVRLLGEELRSAKEELGALTTLECGKIVSEGLGEVQEMIDICDFATGLSRQLYGLTIASERPGHHMREMWHPLGVVGVISAFNFPVAVWSWNAALALVCGNPVIWKPSEKTPFTALACQAICDRAISRFESEYDQKVPEGLLSVLIGRREVGEVLSHHEDVPLVSATGSVPMGKAVAPVVSQRLGRSLLELGGNNGMIVTQSADLSLAVRAILFSAVGTAGQRCTTLRRLFVHDEIYDKLVDSLKTAYQAVRVGNPLDADTLIGPLIDEDSANAMQDSLRAAKEQGGTILCGGERITPEGVEGGAYVTPALVEMNEQSPIVCHETFAPILYVMRYSDYKDTVDLHNSVPQGLSSSVFTSDVKEAEYFLSASGSDCGIANVNIGPSGAEIGGAFGGEKETGGGRESGSDAWKIYMRRQTQTINYSEELPLAQGVVFDL